MPIDTNYGDEPQQKLTGALKHCKTIACLHALADAKELAGAKAILANCKGKLDEVRRKHEKKLKVNPEFVDEHPFYQLGLINAFLTSSTSSAKSNHFPGSTESVCPGPIISLCPAKITFAESFLLSSNALTIPLRTNCTCSKLN